MKRIYLVLLMILMSLSCEESGKANKISFPDKKIKVVENVVYYNNKPYTGQLEIKENSDYKGSISLKDGHLEGVSELKGKSEDEYRKFTIENGKFIDEYIFRDISAGNIYIIFDKNMVSLMKGQFPNALEQDVIIDKDGNANGTMGNEDGKITFKNGEADVDGLKIKLYIDKEVQGKFITEVYENGEVVEKEETMMVPDIKSLEEAIFELLKN